MSHVGSEERYSKWVYDNIWLIMVYTWLIVNTWLIHDEWIIEWGSINGGIPIAGWFVRENPHLKWMMTGGSDMT